MWSKIWLKYSGQTMRCIVTNNQCTVRFVITTPRAPDAVRLGNPPRKNTASLLPRCERLMSGDRATENARLWGRILEQCAAMRPCNTTSSIASSTYRRLVRRLRPHQLRSTFDAVSWDDFCQMGVQLYLYSTTSEHLASRTCVKAPNSRGQLLTFSVARSPTPRRAI